MPVLVEAGAGYPSQTSYPDNSNIPDAGVFISSLPVHGKAGTMENYHPILRSLKGYKGYVINTNINILNSGLKIDWIPKNLGFSAPTIWVPRSFLEKNSLICILKQKEEEWVIKLRFPIPQARGFETKPWFTPPSQS